MRNHRRGIYGCLLGGTAAIALLTAGAAHAQEETQFSIEPQPLSSALNEFGVQSRTAVLFTPELTGKTFSPGLTQVADAESALRQMLVGTDLTFDRNGDTFIIRRAGDPQSASAAGDGAEVEALIVTAQKKEEAIQDVPIAISAFSQKDLEAQKIETGGDLLKAIPNVTFSKNNFSGYNFAIRGIGTKAISVTTDPGVAVEFNSTSLIRNRLFEQEYFDIERVEVLRGPQGTLHGRNATAGVINVISAKPTGEFKGQIKAEVGNYQSRRASGFINVPIISDKLMVRVAGSYTSREGYDYNESTQHRVNGRDLWSARVTLGFEPSERLRGNLIWERFEEDDDRSRTGKQLCTRDQGPTSIGPYDNLSAVAQSYMSQGCQNASLYDPLAYGTPNGLTIPFVLAASFSNLNGFGVIGYDQPDFIGGIGPHALISGDPYGGQVQSPDLRTIASIKDPIYRAKADVFELNFDFDITPSLVLTSLTAYDRDDYYSTQDYNRFNTVPAFYSTDGLFRGSEGTYGVGEPALPVTPGGVFCDPQIGCTNTIAGFDLSVAKSRQFSQELRLQSSLSGPLNFSIGANYTRYRTVEDYYVLFNVITALTTLDTIIGSGGFAPPLCTGPGRLPYGSPDASPGCIYVDPNPLEKINGEGHNYFRSSNPYLLKSAAAFGEAYWDVTPTLKVIGGLRYTDDKKTFTPIPSQALLSSAVLLAGTVDRGYPALPDVDLHWREFSGRLGGQWSPTLSFTDQTMIYAFYSRGYKGGGANPPGIGYNPTPFGGGNVDCSGPPLKDTFLCQPIAQVLPYSANFEPEFVNAFEVGSKNTLLGGALVLNGNLFFYDYKGYQVSQIVNRTAINENFDAHVWGAELESVWQPSRRLRFNLALGYQGSSIGKGSKSLDLMDRIQGHDEYTIFKPFLQLPGNCVVLRSVVEQYTGFALANGYDDYAGYPTLCPGSAFFNQARPLNGPPTDPDIFPGSPGYPFNETVFPNKGQGFFADVSGNELPNAPHWTQSIGVQYAVPFGEDWEATLRADFYHQSQSWARVYQDIIDKLHGWKNANVVLTVSRPDDGLRIEVYAKNIFDDNAITDTFLNSDDSALTTNVFTLDPRLIGLSVSKSF